MTTTQPSTLYPEYPVRVLRLYRAYHATDRLPWEEAAVVATCRSLRELRGRYWHEYRRTRHDGGRAWSGHVLALDARDRRVDLRGIEWWIEVNGTVPPRDQVERIAAEIDAMVARRLEA